MIFFDACAVRAIVTAVTLLVGLSTPPILFDQTVKLLSCGFSSGTEQSTVHTDLKLPSPDYEFTLSLEWSLFKPNRQYWCAKADDVLNVGSVLVGPSSDTLSLEWSLFKPNSRRCVEKTDEQLVKDVRGSTHLFINSSLEPGLDAITLHPLLPIAHSVTGPFVMTTPLPQPIFSGFEQMLELKLDYPTKVDSGCLAYLKQLKLYIRELILNSLPTHWAEWTTHNRLTLGLICVSVMYGSLLCPVLHYLWTQNNVNKKLSKDLKVVCGLKLSVDLQLAMEKNALNGANVVQLNELQDLKTQLRQCQLREVEALETLVLTKEELRKEKWDGGDSRRRIYSDNAKILAQVNRKLEKALSDLSFLQISECNAQIKLRSVEKQLEEERQKRNNKEMPTSKLFAELQEDLQNTKHALKGNIEVTQQKLRLATDKAVQLKTRLSDSMMNDSDMDAEDSGIFESLSDKSIISNRK